MKKFTKALLVLTLAASLLTGCGEDTPAATTPTPEATTTPEATPGGDTAKLYKDVVTLPESLLANRVDATDTGDVAITDDMRKASVINQGNITRLADAMVKAANGEEVTIAYIGGSITDGDSANPKATACYAYLSMTWWQKTFPNATINYVNAGIGATDSYLGVHRVEGDVLVHDPDVVIVEFSVNDYRALNKESYESLLRRILQHESNPAVISLFLTQENGSDYQNNHQVVAFNLSVPMISYRNAIYPAIQNGSLDWLSVGSPDGTHPNNGGHKVIAHFLTNFFNSVLEQIPTMEYKAYEVPTNTTTRSRYEKGQMYDNTNYVAATNDGFDVKKIGGAQFPNGWQTTTGGTISFEVTGTNLGIVFFGTTDGKSGKYDVFIDDELVTTIDANFVGRWGSYADYAELKKFDEEGTHTIRLQPAADSTGDKFTILALTIS